MLPLSHCTYKTLSQFSPLKFPTFSRYLSFSPATRTDLLFFTSKAQSLLQVKQSHAFALINGFLPQAVSICASLILRYGAYRESTTCHRLFDETVQYSKSAFLWNTLIRAFSIARGCGVFEIYNGLVRNDVVRPDDHTFPFVLKACADSVNIRKGMEIHGVVVKLGFDLDVFVGNTLMLFYGNCGNLRDAGNVFDGMTERDVVSWNTVIGMFSVNGCYKNALEFFCEMKLRSEFKPNIATVVSALPVCAGLQGEEVGRQIHGYVVTVGLDSQVTIGNALVDMYGKCKNMKASRRVFDEMTERNEVSWNAVISSLAYHGYNKDVMCMFRLMISETVQPNSVTISTVLPILADLELLNLGKEIHGRTLRFGIESDLFIGNSLIDMYAKLGDSVKASIVFCQMHEKNVVSWNAMVANFAQNKAELRAIELVRQMQFLDNIPNAVTFTNVLPACARLGCLRPGKEIHARTVRMGCHTELFVSNALTDMYAKCGCLSIAENIFKISLKDEISYNILIVGYSQTSDCSKSVSLFLDMTLMGLEPDIISYMGVISACANLTALKQGKEIHGLLLRNNLYTHLFIANSFLDLYTKCGRMDLAIKVFDRIPHKDAASWNTMILGYGMLGELKVAINLFEAMKEDSVRYDSVSYLAVLSACSHGGLVEKGKKYFHLMQAQNVKPTHMHYACMVDLLGRAGLIEEAVSLVKSLPLKPDANVWGALLGACRIHGNIEFAIWAAEHLFELKPQHCGYYAVLSNMYAEAGEWDESNRVRELMKLRGAKKNPGCSWVQIDDQVHAFVAGERAANFDAGPSIL
ncbi:hypothetical protein K2173_019113 [Erythroxylum novogranatense]|uniref:Pentatricopeptide repeat-containing protein n=1 Tax=Erythroxylum novogranatense TaxID=1862640 RepID=A0AAV8STF1_9ROSI|nr:hypothetical protein K2173_019113 [Erythroxylum novogranatense]